MIVADIRERNTVGDPDSVISSDASQDGDWPNDALPSPRGELFESVTPTGYVGYMDPSAGTVAYVDGFNFYNGALRGTDLKWIDLPALIEQVFRLEVDVVRYFAARLADTSGDPGKVDRQARLLQAIQTDPRVTVVEGKFQTNKDWRPWVGAADVRVRPRPEMAKVKLVQEKGSDVNLAAHLLRDAYAGAASVALLVSGDGDLELPVRFAKEAGVDVRVLNPRSDRELSWASQLEVPVYELRRKKLLKALMPEFVSLADGDVVKCPDGWKHQTPPSGGVG